MYGWHQHGSGLVHGCIERILTITPVDETVRATERDQLRRERKRLESILEPLLTTGLDKHLPPAMPDEDLINALAQYLEFQPIEKLALLERDGAIARCRSMVELLEMKAMDQGGENGRLH